VSSRPLWGLLNAARSSAAAVTGGDVPTGAGSCRWSRDRGDGCGQSDDLRGAESRRGLYRNDGVWAPGSRVLAGVCGDRGDAHDGLRRYRIGRSRPRSRGVRSWRIDRSSRERSRRTSGRLEHRGRWLADGRSRWPRMPHRQVRSRS